MAGKTIGRVSVLVFGEKIQIKNDFEHPR